MASLSSVNSSSFSLSSSSNSSFSLSSETSSSFSLSSSSNSSFSLSSETSSSFSLSSLSTSSPLYQLKEWTERRIGGPLIIEGGIPPVRIFVQFAGSPEEQLQIPRDIKTREEFILFLAEHAHIDPYFLDYMLETGMIFATITPITKEWEIVEFFKQFVHEPMSHYLSSTPTPAFVQPVSDERKKAFKKQFPEKLFGHSVKTVRENSKAPSLSQLAKSTTRALEPLHTIFETPQVSPSQLTKWTARSISDPVKTVCTIPQASSPVSQLKEWLVRISNQFKTGLKTPQLSQLREWTVRSISDPWIINGVVMSRPLVIEGGIPPVTVSVQFADSPEEQLQIPRGIKTREEFILFLAAHAHINPYYLESMFETGAIYATIRPVDSDREVEEFFRQFVYEPTSHRLYPTPSFVEPVSDRSKSAFKEQFPAKFSSEPSKIIREVSNKSPLFQLREWIARSTSEPLIIEEGIPPVAIEVKFSNLGERLQIPPNIKIKTREEFILFLAWNLKLEPQQRNRLIETGQIYATIRPVNTDLETVEFFGQFVYNSMKDWFATPPPFVQPVSAEGKAAFNARLLSEIPQNFINRVSPLSQLRKWTAKSISDPWIIDGTVVSRPLIIEGGIPPVTVSVQFARSSEQQLRILPGIETREEFMLFLAEHLDINPYYLESMLETGAIYATITPIDCEEEEEEFFRQFVHEPRSHRHSPTPSFVEPVSYEKRIAFRKKCSAKFSAEPFKAIPELPPFSPLAQLKRWIATSTSKPLVIDVGIPPVTIAVRFGVGMSKRLQIPRNIRTREEFIQFLANHVYVNLHLANHAHVDPYYLVNMLEKGEIRATITPINTDLETMEFFRLFVHEPASNWLSPTPSFVQPVSDKIKAPFKSRFPLAFPAPIPAVPPPVPSKLSKIDEEGLPQIPICVKFGQYPQRTLTIPSGIKTRKKFLRFLVDNVGMPPVFKESMLEKEIVLSPRVVQPIDTTDSEMMNFFEEVLNYIPPALPTIYVKFPYSNPLIFKFPPNVKSPKKFMQFLGRIAINIKMPSHIRDYMLRDRKIGAEVGLIDTDSESVSFFKNFFSNYKDEDLSLSIPISQPIEAASKAPLKLRAPSTFPTSFSGQPISSSQISTTKTSTPIVNSQLFRIHREPPLRTQGKSIVILHRESREPTVRIHEEPTLRIHKAPALRTQGKSIVTLHREPLELPQEDFQMIINNKMQDPYLLKVPPKINSLEEFKKFIKEVLSKQGKEVHSKFAIGGGGKIISNYNELRKILSNPPVALHIFGVVQLTQSSTSLRGLPPGLSSLPLYQSLASDSRFTEGMKEFPQGLINIALPWTFSADNNWDFSDCYHTVEIASGIRSLGELKLFLRKKVPMLQAANFADFDLKYMKENTWVTVYSEDELMLYLFKQIQAHSVPFFACIERKPPEPSPLGSRQREPKPFTNSPETGVEAFIRRRKEGFIRKAEWQSKVRREWKKNIEMQDRVHRAEQERVLNKTHIDFALSLWKYIGLVSPE